MTSYTTTSAAAVGAKTARDDAYSISTLLCESHAEMAGWCFQSLQKCADKKVNLIIHDDGSLREEDAERLKNLLGDDIRIIWRAEADARMADELRRYPASAAFRKKSCMGLKLMDSLYYSDSETYIYSDADVFFFKPFKEMFDLDKSADAPVNAIFMHDAWDNCYSFRSWDLLRSSGIHLPWRVNSGLGCLRRSRYDPDWIEWFLSKPWHMGNNHNGLPEQTAWALLANRVGMRKWDSEQVTVMLPDTSVEGLTVGHFTYFTRPSLKDHYQRFQEQTASWSPTNNTLERVSVKTVEAGKCTAGDLFVQETRRITERLISRSRDVLRK